METKRLWPIPTDTEFVTIMGAAAHIDLPTGEHFEWPLQYLFIRGNDGQIYSGYVPWPPGIEPVDNTSALSFGIGIEQEADAE